MFCTHGLEGNLQLVALHRPTAVPVVGCEGVLPAIQSLPQFLELIEAHAVGIIPLRQHSQGPVTNFSQLYF